MIVETITLQRNVRERMYFVITMPLNVEGQGPCGIQDAAEILFEVWDQVATSYGSFKFLPDAIAFAELRNEQHLKLITDSVEAKS